MPINFDYFLKILIFQAIPLGLVLIHRQQSQTIKNTVESVLVELSVSIAFNGQQMSMTTIEPIGNIDMNSICTTYDKQQDKQ